MDIEPVVHINAKPGVAKNLIVLNSGPWWSPRKCIAAGGNNCSREEVEKTFRRGMISVFKRLREIYSGIIIYRLSTANRKECLDRRMVINAKA